MRRGGAFTNLRSRGLQLASRTPRERLGPDLVEHFVGGGQVSTGVCAAVLAAKPLTVEKLDACELRPHLGVAEPLDRLAVQSVGGLPVAHQH